MRCWRLPRAVRPPAISGFATTSAHRAPRRRRTSRQGSAGSDRLQFAHFLGIAKASLVETQNHLIDARERRYIEAALFCAAAESGEGGRTGDDEPVAIEVTAGRRGAEPKRRATNRRRGRSSRSPDDASASPAADHGVRPPAGATGQRTPRRNNTRTAMESSTVSESRCSRPRRNESTVGAAAARYGDRTKARSA